MLASTRVLVVMLASLPLAACKTTAPPETAEAPALLVPEAAVPDQPFFTGEARWRPIFQGIDHAELATDTPRYLVVQVLRIDTTAEGLELFTTPGNGDEPLDTNGQTTRAFLEEHGLSVAINTHFFSPCCNRLPGEAKDLTGVSIAQGETVSVPRKTSQQDVIYFAHQQEPNTPTIDVFPMTATMLVSFYEEVNFSHAIAGRMVLRDGRVMGGKDEFSTARHPRTLVGVNQFDGLIYLVTIDGRQRAFSMGASLAEAAAIMHHIGASDALNIDGGGSTTMVLRDPDGASQLLNSPSGGFERVVGSNLGLRALPLQPEATPAP